MSYKTKPIDKIVTPFKKIFEHEKAGGIVLFLSVIIALILANSPIKEEYHHFFENTFLVFMSME
jgi:NhaA family Na+:H+ antiporter